MARLWTTAEVADEVGFSEEWVREHAAELGGIRTGTSKHSQLPFNPKRIREWEERSQSGSIPGSPVLEATTADDALPNLRATILAAYRKRAEAGERAA